MKNTDSRQIHDPRIMPSVEYPVRTPFMYWTIVLVLVAVAAYSGRIFSKAILAGMADPLFVGVGLVLVAVPFIYLATTGHLRARGVVRISPDEIVVPDWRGRPQHFPLPGTEISVVPVPFAFILFFIDPFLLVFYRRVVIVELRTDGRRRTLSSLLLRRSLLRPFLADLDRVRHRPLSEGPR